MDMVPSSKRTENKWKVPYNIYMGLFYFIFLQYDLAVVELYRVITHTI